MNPHKPRLRIRTTRVSPDGTERDAFRIDWGLVVLLTVAIGSVALFFSAVFR